VVDVGLGLKVSEVHQFKTSGHQLMCHLFSAVDLGELGWATGIVADPIIPIADPEVTFEGLDESYHLRVGERQIFPFFEMREFHDFGPC
jgi:hypothetical protein